jgi:DNA-binding XRE family transcriptional regulator
MTWKEKLGEDIQKARDQFPGGMSQEQLAALVKFSRTSIVNYETGKRAPNFEQLQKMAKVLQRTHFDAGSMRIDFGSNGRPHPEPVPQQLELYFDDKNGVNIRIEPVSRSLIIKKLSA